MAVAAGAWRMRMRFPSPAVGGGGHGFCLHHGELRRKLARQAWKSGGRWRVHACGGTGK